MTVTPDAADPDAPGWAYDEFAYFGENQSEYGLAAVPARVERASWTTSDGLALSGLAWGNGRPEMVLLHGGAQNAHTWDTVLLAMGQPPALAIDLPGHGRSDRRTDHRYDPLTNAAAIADVLDTVVGAAVPLVGMSLGGLSANCVAARRPDLVSSLVVIDVTPGVDRDKTREIHDFIEGPQCFDSFAEMFERTRRFNPSRSDASLRRGILHNAHRRADGRWEWNYDRGQLAGADLPSMADLWTDIGAIECDYLLLRGALSPVVDDGDVAELHRRLPNARVEVFDGAGHSIQGDRPLELATRLRALVGDPGRS